MRSHVIALVFLSLLGWTVPSQAEFRCAGRQGPSTAITLPAGVAAKPARTAQSATTGTRQALVLFARFKGDSANPVPSWAGDLFNPDLPGSFSHFYDTMSFGKLQVRGEVAPRVYESLKPASAYLSSLSGEQGQFGRFAQEILQQADRDIDFAQFDNDGPDGVPNSGDDDGVVDAVFIVMDRIPAGFLLSEATGIASLGFEGTFATADPGAGGPAIQILPSQGTFQQGRSFAEAAGSMCHEYGHVLGLPDLYDTKFLGLKDRRPEDDSAGVGAWCLMGWGASGWNGNDGPNSFSAWSRIRLGWAEVKEIASPQEEMHLAEIGKTGAVYKVPANEGEYFLLEYRTRQSTYYDRHLPGEGLLIWHVKASEHTDLFQVDLECADGKWADAGYPKGQRADPQQGSDNLDFWAHDDSYARVHNGNQGDATDPFDGIRFAAFTPDTNPSSYSLDGLHSVRIEQIHFNAGVALAQVQTDPLHLEFEEVELYDGDGLLTVGETAALKFLLHNQGGLTVPGVRTVLSSADPLVHIDQPEVQYGDVELGYRLRPLRGQKRPSVSLLADPGVSRQVSLILEAFSGQTLLARHEISMAISSSVKWSGRLVDEAGNGVGDVKVNIYKGSSSSAVTTAQDGTFQTNLVPGSYSTSINRSSFTVQYGFTLTANLYSELVLPTAYPVSGTIRGSENLPLSGINLSTYRFLGNGGYFEGRAISVLDGTYTLMLPKGEYNISVMGTPRDWADDVLSNIYIDGPRTLDIGLEKGVRLTLQVTDEQGDGSIAGQVGRWTFNGRGGGSTLNITAGKGVTRQPPGNSQVRVYSLSFGNGEISLRGIGLFLPLLSDTTIQVVLPKQVSVRGKVADEAVEPYLNTYLMFETQAPYFDVGTKAADDGMYEVALPPGRSQIVYQGYEPGKWLQQWVGERSTTGSNTFDVSLQRGERIEGRVVDEEGKGLAGLDLQALSVDSGTESGVQTGEDGSFRFFLQPGSYEFTGIEPGQIYHPLGKVEVLAAATLDLRLPAQSTLRGQTTSGQEMPLGNTVVALVQAVDPPLLAIGANSASLTPQFYHSGDLAGGSISDQLGNYQLRAQPGTYDLVVLPDLGTGLGQVVHGVRLSGDRPLDLHLPAPERAYRLYGQILGESATTKLVLQFFDTSTGIIAQISDEGFRGYGVELPPGRYRVRAGLLGPVGGFQRVYDLGERRVSEDAQWDLDLSEVPTAVAEEETVRPQQFRLDPNYPNPFNPTTTLRFNLPQAGAAELSIYNLMGQREATLVHGPQEAGPHILTWDGRDEQGRELASGVYFYRLQAGQQVETRKLLLLR